MPKASRLAHFTLAAALLPALFARPSDAADATAQLPDPDGKPADMSKPVKVYILMGQSNMLEMGKVAGDKEGTLEHAVKSGGLYPYLVDDAGNWTVRQDVRNVAVMGSGGPGKTQVRKNDWLKVAGGKIGVEIGIGHHMGHVHDEPVLILKSAIGNRSLGWDLLPPGSPSYEFTDPKDGKTYVYAGYGQSPLRWEKGTEPVPIGWKAGLQYDGDIARAKEVLSNLGTYYPGATEYEVAGFFYWQGDKDRYNAGHSQKYEQNLVNLIKTLRKEFNAPNAKFVCATLGQTNKDNATGTEKDIIEAQLAVSDPSKHPEFKGSVATVYTHPLSKGGASNSHYGGNAETYMNVGEAMGKAMVELLNGGPKKNYVSRAVLSNEQEQIVLKLAANRGIKDVSEISTYNLYPTAARGISVKGVDQIKGREVSNQILRIQFKDWWHPGQGPRDGDIQIGDFWAGKPVIQKQTILMVAGKEYRTASIQGLSIEESESVLGRLLSGNYKVGTGVQDRTLEQIDWNRPQGFRKAGEAVSVSFLHKSEGGGFFDLELKVAGEELAIQQILQAVP
ncbi:MAG: hypothetical protein O3C17_25260 [Planctomycetota bacterium]|nr:hypothetical protein [Planctomycetota bacterium]